MGERFFGTSRRASGKVRNRPARVAGDDPFSPRKTAVESDYPYQLIPAARESAYLDSATYGPASERTVAAIVDFAQSWSRGSTRYEVWHEAFNRGTVDHRLKELIRVKMSRYVTCSY